MKVEVAFTNSTGKNKFVACTLIPELAAPVSGCVPLSQTVPFLTSYPAKSKSAKFG
jgi:hypothetical protein